MSQDIRAELVAELNNDDVARRFSRAELCRQIGTRKILAISGGRVGECKSGIELPVAKGYRVYVSLAGNDTYTVRRVYKRGQRFLDKGVMMNVNCEEVGEVAYRASCYHDEF